MKLEWHKYGFSDWWALVSVTTDTVNGRLARDTVMHIVRRQIDNQRLWRVYDRYPYSSISEPLESFAKVSEAKRWAFAVAMLEYQQ